MELDCRRLLTEWAMGKNGRKLVLYMKENRCAFLHKEHYFEIREEDIPVPKDDEALVKIEANGICGSDIHFFAEGRLGNFLVTTPYIPGHEASGTVIAVGKNVNCAEKGQRVIIEPGIPCGRCEKCLSGRYNLCRDVVFFSAPPTNGTLCDYICVRADFLHKMPDELSFIKGAMAEPAAVAVHAVNQAIKAGSIAGKTAAVIGAGPIGLLVMQVFKIMGGGRVTAVDISEFKLKKAKELGADYAVNSANFEVEDNSADVVFETAGVPKTTAQMLQIVRPGGTMIQVGWPAGNMVTMNIADFIEKELTYKSVNRYANAFPAAIQYLTDGRIEIDKMISKSFSFEQTEDAFRYAHDFAGEVIKIAIMN